MRNPNIDSLLTKLLGQAKTDALFATLNMPAILDEWETDVVTRAEIAQAMNMALFEGLLERSANGRAYTAEAIENGGSVYFDHGALRTVRWPSGALPAGEAAFTRVLRPLGFELQGTYPLPRLKMTGRAYSHRDFPEEIAQFFVSELHPEQFSAPFQSAVTRVLSTSRDPLGPQDIADLEQLTRDGVLPLAQALRLLPQLLQCFDRQHGVFALDDYELLLAESAEMAWISTEGNAFNHATDRVDDVDAVAARQRALGRPIKDKVEVSASGRVRQTAFRAASVQREFITPEGRVSREVPGSFYEFITRDALQTAGAANDPVQPRLDLAFDAGNATGIFGMTAARA